MKQDFLAALGIVLTIIGLYMMYTANSKIFWSIVVLTIGGTCNTLSKRG